jgi:hypothetical protein
VISSIYRHLRGRASLNVVGLVDNLRARRIDLLPGLVSTIVVLNNLKFLKLRRYLAPPE